MTERTTQLVVALDIPDRDDAIALADRIKEYPVIIKIGWVLYPHTGHDGLIGLSKNFKGRIFLDFKLHDIPSVIAKGVESLMNTVDFEILTLHTSGGHDMMKVSSEKCMDRFQKGSMCTRKPLLLGVTVLTSFDSESFRKTGYRFETTEEAVPAMASMAKNAGLDGVVSSVHEVQKLRDICGEDFKILTPGIRPAGSEKGDQSRVATPSEAKELGSDYIVVGRPIIQADDPCLVVEQILHELG